MVETSVVSRARKWQSTTAVVRGGGNDSIVEWYSMTCWKTGRGPGGRRNSTPIRMKMNDFRGLSKVQGKYKSPVLYCTRSVGQVCPDTRWGPMIMLEKVSVWSTHSVPFYGRRLGNVRPPGPGSRVHTSPVPPCPLITIGWVLAHPWKPRLMTQSHDIA